MDKVRRVVIEDPPIGGKPWLLNEKGVFVLEEGPGMLQVCLITHAGAGELDIYDGVPDEEGFFPDQNIPQSDPKYGAANGRRFSSFSPVYMGAWQMNAGFHHGLTIICRGGDQAPFATFVWTAKGKSVVSPRFQKAEVKPEKYVQNIKDVTTPAAPGSLMRSVTVSDIGIKRIARRTAELYSVMITHAGSFCRLILRHGDGTPFFDQFSTFTGSFLLGACAKEGVLVDIDGNQMAPLIQVNWREPDMQLI